MIVWLYIAVLFVNLIECFLQKNNKILNIITVLFIIIFVGGNNYNADYNGYIYFYRNNISSTFEPGYLFFSSLARKIGLDYQMFVMMLVTLALMLIMISVLYLRVPFPMVAVLYLITMSFLDAVQIRQFVCYCIYTIALIVLSQNKRIAYIALVLLASTFQLSALLYIPLVFLNGKKYISKELIKCFVIIIILLCGVVFLMGNTIPFLEPLMARYLNAEKIIYFQTSTRLGFLKYFLFHFVCLFFMYITNEFVNREGNEKMTMFSDVVYKSVMYTSIALPLVMLNNNFTRFFKFNLIGLIILSAYSVSLLLRRNELGNYRVVRLPMKRNGKIDVYILLLIMFCSIYWFALQISSVVSDVFGNNIFF